jgi:hypothetical protein
MARAIDLELLQLLEDKLGKEDRKKSSTGNRVRT